MATRADIRRIALSLPGVEASTTDFAFGVRLKPKDKPKGIAWSWKERVDPKRARVPSTTVIAVRVACEEEKQALIALDPAVFFTEPHYNGYPAVLVRFAGITATRLRQLLTNARRCFDLGGVPPTSRARRGN